MEHLKSDIKEGASSRISFWILSFFVLLFPLFYLPSGVAFLEASKTIFASSLILIVFMIWIINKLKDTKVRIPVNLLSLSILIVIAVSIISSAFSINPYISFFGRDFINDNVLLLALSFVSLVLFANSFSSVKKHFYLNLMILLSVVVTLVVHILNITLGQFLPDLGLFFSASASTLGKWYDFGIFSAFGLVFSILSIELFKQSKMLKVLFYIVMVLSLFALTTIGFATLWYLVAIFSLVIFAYVLTSNREKGKFPTVSLITFLIAFVFIISQNIITPVVNNFFNIDFVEARPSLSATFEIIKESIKTKPVLGYGAGEFNVLWSKFRPTDVNVSDFWNVDFGFGYSYLMTVVANTGILGMLSWLFMIVMLVAVGFKSVFKKDLNETSKYLIFSSFLIALFFWIILGVYSPGIVIYLLTFVFTGIFVGSLIREGMFNFRTIDISTNPKFGFLYVFILILMLVGTITGAYHFASKFLSGVFYQKSISYASVGNLDSASVSAINALNFYKSDLYLQTIAQIEVGRINQVLNNSNISNTDKGNAVQQLISSAVGASEAAIAFDGNNYRNYESLANLYSSIADLKVQGAYDQAKIYYERMRDVNSKSPLLALNLARLEMRQGNNDQARKYISEAINLKPNYTDAVFLLAQIDVSEGKIDQAIQNVQTAILVRPNDSTAYFQLGILHYQKEDFSSAASSFEKAVILNPYYSNAKYFLGLSYSRIDRNADAILQFADLEILNPDNQEVKLILENLRQGKAPFAGMESAESESPESREDLPLEDEGSEQ